MIYRLTEKVAVEPILKLIEASKGQFKLPIDKIAKYLEDAVNDDDAIVLIDEKDRKVNGILYASIEYWDGERVVFIHLCVISPEVKNTGFVFLSRVNKWGQEKKVKKIIISTDRPQGFIKKYKFKQTSVILAKDIKQED